MTYRVLFAFLRVLGATTASALVLSSSLFAGPVSTGKEIAPELPPVPECNWTGLYLGFNAGYFWGRSVSIQDSQTNTAFEENPGTSITLEDDGVIGGGQIGYDWQINRFVLGIEGRAGGLNFDKEEFQYSGNDNWANAKYDWYGALTGRVGLAWNKFLFYAKGGAAWVNTRNDAADVDGRHLDADSTVHREGAEFAPTIGGGVDVMLHCNWSLRVEYALFDIDDTHSNSPGSGTEDAGPGRYRHEHELHTVTAGISYRFGPGR